MLSAFGRYNNAPQFKIQETVSSFLPFAVNYAFIALFIHTHAHTHAHAQREREREGGRESSQQTMGWATASGVCVFLQLDVCFWGCYG